MINTHKYQDTVHTFDGLYLAASSVICVSWQCWCSLLFYFINFMILTKDRIVHLKSRSEFGEIHLFPFLQRLVPLEYFYGKFEATASI